MKRTLCFLLFAAVISHGEETYFFRIASTQITHVASFSPTAGITWSNTVAPASCSIEWAPDLRGLWLTNHFPSSVFCTGVLHHVDVPAVITTGTPSTVIYDPAGSVTVSDADSTAVDLDRDGEADIIFRTESISSADVPTSSYYFALHVETRQTEVITRPYMDGERIAPTPQTEDNWAQGGAYDQTLISSHLTVNWEGGGGEGRTEGPWYGARNACLPLRINTGAQYHYGWIRLSLAYLRFNDTTDFWQLDFRVLDSALNAVPGKSILAGER